MFTLLIYSAAGRRCETKRVQTLARIAGVTRHDTAPPMKPEFQMVAAIRYIDALRFAPTSELALFHIASLPLSIPTK